MAIAIGQVQQVASYTETLDAGGSDRTATITITVTRVGAAAATSVIAFSPPTLMTETELTDYQAFVDAVDEQAVHLRAAVDALAVQAAT